MFLTTLKPDGEVTSFDMAAVAIWQLGVEIVVTKPAFGKEAPQHGLAVCVRYQTPMGASVIKLTVLDCNCPRDDLIPVITKGFPVHDRAAACDRLKESLKVLINSNLTQELMDSILEKSHIIIDTYFDFREAVFKNGTLDSNCNSTRKAGGYTWFLTPGRFEAGVNVPKPDPPTEKPEKPEKAEATEKRETTPTQTKRGTPPSIGKKH